MPEDFDNVILSTGMSSLQEIKQAVKIISKINKRLTILHCIAVSYSNRQIELKFFRNTKKNLNFH